MSGAFTVHRYSVGLSRLDSNEIAHRVSYCTSICYVAIYLSDLLICHGWHSGCSNFQKLILVGENNHEL
jgi:hypothetical protein